MDLCVFSKPIFLILFADTKPCTGILNPDQEDQMTIKGYRHSYIRCIICWTCICLTGGILRLFLHWWRHWHLFATSCQCPLDEAEKVLITEDYEGKHKQYYVKNIRALNVNNPRFLCV